MTGCCWPDGAIREENNPLELLVVEEIVEGPETPFFSERIRVQIRVVATNRNKEGIFKRGFLAAVISCYTMVSFCLADKFSPVNVTALQVDFLVDGIPQLGPHRVKLFAHGWDQAAVHCISHLQGNDIPISISQGWGFYSDV